MNESESLVHTVSVIQFPLVQPPSPALQRMTTASGSSLEWGKEGSIRSCAQHVRPDTCSPGGRGGRINIWDKGYGNVATGAVGPRAPSSIPRRTRSVWWCLGRTQSQVREISDVYQQSTKHQGRPVIPEGDDWHMTAGMTAEQRLMGRTPATSLRVCVYVCVVDCDRAHYQEAHSFLLLLLEEADTSGSCCVCVCYACVLCVCGVVAPCVLWVVYGGAVLGVCVLCRGGGCVVVWGCVCGVCVCVWVWVCVWCVCVCVIVAIQWCVCGVLWWMCVLCCVWLCVCVCVGVCVWCARCVCVCLCGYVCVCVGCWLAGFCLQHQFHIPHPQAVRWSRDLSRLSVSWVNLTKTRCISHKSF